MELRVNDYVRTKDGLVRKIVEIDKLIYIDKDYISDEPEYHNSLIEEDIIKSSPNIIDLIEVGDYVNGMEVTRIDGTYHGRKDIAIYCEHNGNEEWKQVMIYDDEIKSIVTKEQFESMEYKVGE